jgi:hypothetical protein
LKNEMAIIEKQGIDEAAIRYPEIRRKIVVYLCQAVENKTY